MAKKSKADAAASGKENKPKASGRSISSRAKKSARAKKVGSEAVPVAATAFDPSDEQIQMRAYFISERRRRFALPGDANSDWLEAKRQLLSETRH